MQYNDTLCTVRLINCVNSVSSDQMHQLSTPSIHRAALWILGEYCTSVEDISRVVQEIRVALGEVGIT